MCHSVTDIAPHSRELHSGYDATGPKDDKHSQIVLTHQGICEKGSTLQIKSEEVRKSIVFFSSLNNCWFLSSYPHHIDIVLCGIKMK